MGKAKVYEGLTIEQIIRIHGGLCCGSRILYIDAGDKRKGVHVTWIEEWGGVRSGRFTRHGKRKG